MLIYEWRKVMKNKGKIIVFTKEDGIMYEVLKNMRNKSAIDLLKENGISLTPPINISLLLRRLGIKEVEADFSDIEKILKYDMGEILGITFAQEKQVGIFYRSRDSINRRRFTIAHEIAHCCLHTDTLNDKHIELRSSKTQNDPREYNANVFAGELLIPESSLKRIYEQLLVPSLSGLSEIFQVSTNVMAKRLDYLKMPYMKDEEISEN